MTTNSVSKEHPNADLIVRLMCVVGNPSAWPECFNPSISELIREAVAALRTSSGGVTSGEVVKRLEWDDPSGHGATPYFWAICAKTQTKGYRIDWEGYGLGHTDHPGPYNLMDIGLFPTIEAAKAAAQSDFEQRILSSLSPPTGGVSIEQLQGAHIERQEEWCPDQKPDLSFRGNEMGGECGEAQNVIKKLERERHGWRGSRDTVEHLGQELADVVHTAVLCAITAGIELGPYVVTKFNETSEKNGLSTFLPSPPEAGK